MDAEVGRTLREILAVYNRTVSEEEWLEDFIQITGEILEEAEAQGEEIARRILAEVEREGAEVTDETMAAAIAAVITGYIGELRKMAIDRLRALREKGIEA